MCRRCPSLGPSGPATSGPDATHSPAEFNAPSPPALKMDEKPLLLLSWHYTPDLSPGSWSVVDMDS